MAPPLTAAQGLAPIPPNGPGRDVPAPVAPVVSKWQAR
jgi:hypothetical protein